MRVASNMLRAGAAAAGLLACSSCLCASAAPSPGAGLTFQSSAFGAYYPSEPTVYTEDYWAAEEGVGHFSEWSKAQKRKFIDVVRSGDDAAIRNWTIVMGNEGGDLDSMASALAWAYHLDHIKGDVPGHDHARTVALLQTPEDALDLRPENKLALANAKMSPGHRDLLTIDELPLPAEELARKIKGIVIVDHPRPRSIWDGARVLSLFDHHTDRGAAPDAKPRIIERTASCSTIVARTLLDERAARAGKTADAGAPGTRKEEDGYHLPHEMLELILSAIALDSDALSKQRSTPADVQTASRLLHLSRFRDSKLQKVMDELDDEMGKAKKALDDLSVRDLLRRDWKGDVVLTHAEDRPNIHLGFASIPLSLEDQIERTLHQRVASWFDIESQWTDEIDADVSVALTSFKVARNSSSSSSSDESGDAHAHARGRGRAAKGKKSAKKEKRRQIILSVRSDKNINEQQADELFDAIKRVIEADPVLEADPWPRAAELGKRQMVWEHSVAAGGRKLVRPIIESAVQSWGA